MTSLWPPYPLFDLFVRLRVSLKLDLTDYMLLLRALNSGFGCKNLRDLRKVCRLLWLKTNDPDICSNFNEIFDDYCRELPERVVPENVSASTESGLRTDPIASADPSDAPRPTTPLPRKDDSEIKDGNLPDSAGKTLGAIQAQRPLSASFSDDGFTLSPTVFPFQDRLTRQTWRTIEQLVPDGDSDELDIEEAIRRIGLDGFCCDKPVKPKLKSSRQIVFFVDREGSMVPFRDACQRLLNTVDGDDFSRVSTYYFNNCPGGSVADTPKGMSNRSLADIYSSCSPMHTLACVISDAGCARGGYSTPRIVATEEFLVDLKERVQAIVWLNPFPLQRWQGTTAEVIDSVLETMGDVMGEMTQDGLREALRRTH